MQFIAKDLLTLELDTASNESPVTSVMERALLAADLAAESLRASGRLRLRVRGESMLPTLWPGDVVEIASCSIEDVRPGEIVLAVREARFFLHRVVGRSSTGGFLLRGDSMPHPDPKFSDCALIGRMESSPRSVPWPRAIGLLLCYFGLARRLGLKIHAGRRGRDMRAGDGAGPYLAQARGQECPRYTQQISELPRAEA
jgi:hypothetical protein